MLDPENPLCLFGQLINKTRKHYHTHTNVEIWITVDHLALGVEIVMPDHEVTRVIRIILNSSRLALASRYILQLATTKR